MSADPPTEGLLRPLEADPRESEIIFLLCHNQKESSSDDHKKNNLFSSLTASFRSYLQETLSQYFAVNAEGLNLAFAGLNRHLK